MPTSDGDRSYGSNSNPSSTSTYELGNGGTPPQLKKSRTITASSSAASSHGSSPPLVRRAATAALPPPRRLTVTVDNPSDSPANGGVLDRDWFYPSFLGPYAARPRSNSRAATGARPPAASSGTRKMELPPPPKRLADRSKVVVPEEVNKELVKRSATIDERSKNLFSYSSSSSRSPKRNFRFDNSFILLIVSI